MIRAIVAIDDRRGYVKDGDIPWDIPDDKAYYRHHTDGHTIVMGRGTYAKVSTPRPNRRNIVASTHMQAVAPGFELIRDIPAFLSEQTDDVWIIGGAGVYTAALPFCEELYITHISGDFECDGFFPDFQDFQLGSQTPIHKQNGYQFYYAVYKKKNR